MWDDGNTVGNWIAPFSMVIGWVLLGCVSIAAVVLVAALAHRAVQPPDGPVSGD